MKQSAVQLGSGGAALVVLVTWTTLSV